MVIKLTDMQLVLLTVACQREDGSLLPPAESLGDFDSRIRKSIEALIKKQLASEVEGMTSNRAWRTDGDVVIGAVITDAGRAVIELPKVGDPVASGQPKIQQPARAAPSRKASKQDQVIVMMQREGGAPLTEMTEATGWLPHSVRAVLSCLRKKGYEISRTGSESGSVYRIVRAAQ